MISISGNGQVMGVSTAEGITLVRMAEDTACDVAVTALLSVSAFDDQVWTCAGDGAALELRRYTPDGEPVGDPLPLGDLGPSATVHAAALGMPAIVVHGERAIEVRDDCGHLVIDEIGAGLTACWPLAPRTWIASRRNRVWVRRSGADVAIAVPADLCERLALVGAHPLHDGTAAVLALREGGSTTLLVVDLRRGGLRQRLRVDDVRGLWVVQKRGQAILQQGERQLLVLDLHRGAVLKQWTDAAPITDLALDHAGRCLVIEHRGSGGGFDHLLIDYDGWLGAASTSHAAASAPTGARIPTPKRAHGTPTTDADADAGAAPEHDDAIPDADADAIADADASAGPDSPRAPDAPAPDAPAPAVDVPARAAPSPRAISPASPGAGGRDRSIAPGAAIAAGADSLLRSPRPLVALAPRPPRAPLDEESLVTHLESCLELVAAWCRQAIAAGWDSGRLATPAPGDLPFASEVRGILDASGGLAMEVLADARRRAEASERKHRMLRAADAADPAAPTTGPLARLMTEFGISDLAADILLVVAAPLLWGELARTYGIVANDPARPLCDELLVGQILGPERASRREIARELDPGQPLLRYGLVEQGAGLRPFAPLTVPSVVVARLWGEEPQPRGAVSRRPADRRLDELRALGDVPAAMVEALARAPEEGHVRIVVRGRLGSGRRTLLAALAAAAGRELEEINVALVLRAGRSSTELLRAELRDCLLRGAVPCISASEHLPADDSVVLEQTREVFRSHPGPLAFRVGAAMTPPIDAGYLAFDLPPATEDERCAAWAESLARHGLPVALADDLAARYRIGPGTVERIARQARAGDRPARPGEEALHVEETLRQHRTSRIGTVATRVTRLDSWSKLVLPPELVDSLREFIGRVRHRRTVYDTWGFGRLVTTSRGLTALFEGGPGTGKTMVAGIIARELGYELYRIDLGKVLSKWIGETEKNLGAVFDAAEEGEVVLVFDEADSLFAKRTEVKTSVDRYANAEVNYLLQRIDSFEGIAILTTNFGTAIDPAFKRRLSFRLTFPFPDEEMRERLWRAHVPPGLPIEGELDLGALAGGYQLSGGYIRNVVLRAAFLAAQQDRPVSQEHLVRALKLEYREQGKLLEGGLLE